MPTRPPAGPLVGALLLATVVLAGCSEDTPPAQEVPAAERLEQAASQLVDSGSFRVELTSTDLPSDTDEAVISATGSGTIDPAAFEGTVTARLQGIQVEVPVVAVDDALHVKLPYAPSYASVSPDELGVPDPARLFDADSGVVSLLGATQDAAYGEQTRDGEEILQEVAGTLPGQPVLDVLQVGSGDAEFDVTYGLVEAEGETPWQVRTVSITGPFYPSAASTYVLTLDEYGEPVTVEAP